MTYVSFDRFPSAKGAATHIDAFARGLGAAFGPIQLLTVASRPDTPAAPYRYQPGVLHVPLAARGANLIQRVLDFRRQLLVHLAAEPADVIHIRSIFEGYPIVRDKRRFCDQLVYEVNGLPSIELKYHYPEVADDRELVGKLRAQEQACLAAADLVVTVSEVTARHLVLRGVDPRRLRVIPNGVDPEMFPFRRPRPWDGRPVELLYSGTMAPWQGVLVAVDCLALLLRELPARLLLVGDARPRQIRQLQRHCDARSVASQVTIQPPVSQSRLAELLHQADVILAPLKSNDRNLVQGCCPLKILEAMSSGTPLIASDLPVVRALARPAQDATLVRPGSAKAIKDAVLRLRDDPHQARQLAASARRRVKQHFPWQAAQRQLVSAYEEVLGRTPASSSASRRDSRPG